MFNWTERLLFLRDGIHSCLLFREETKNIVKFEKGIIHFLANYRIIVNVGSSFNKGHLEYRDVFRTQSSIYDEAFCEKMLTAESSWLFSQKALS